ncbi:hypothetical protein GCM10011348_09520 [Marinobacterium nitratireducens]|uniref:Outer membrane protein beta-barrel domain-containing protein n=1 Tax=Marinobacterium nitratireducens TaxID=518897 RepID=A0A917ZBC6_9GAMM|nr:outer membrane beta-barrel protein [Marinobacterium nitratireducens]GGO78192.1 hypothetical protein GCM10011348_09520 [Marinobacterium nitratireducens]
MSKKLLSAALFSAAVFGSANAAAQGGYFGAGLGWAEQDVPKSDVNQALADFAAEEGLVVTPSIGKIDDSDKSYRIYFGYAFNDYVAVEGAFTNMGKPSADFEVGPFSEGVSFETEGYELSLVGTIPLNYGFGIYGRVGAFNWETDIEYLDQHEVADGTDVVYGLGLTYALNANWDVRAEYAHYEIDYDDDLIGGKADIDNYTASLSYRF